MSEKRIQALQYFQENDVPTESQFAFLLNSILFKDEQMDIGFIENLTQLLNDKLGYGHASDENAHHQHLAAIDGSNLDIEKIELWKTALGIRNLATTGENGTVYDKSYIDALVSSFNDVDEQLLAIVDSIKQMLLSNDLNLDELQEIVDFIKQNRADIEALQAVIIGQTTDDKIQLVGNYSYWGAVTLQNQFNDVVFDKLKQIEEHLQNIGVGRFEAQIDADSHLEHNLNTYDLAVEAYDIVTMYTVPLRMKRLDLNSVAIEFDTPPANVINITIKKI